MKPGVIPGSGLGERRRAFDVGLKGHELYEWHACVGCGRLRWAIIVKGKRAHSACVGCGTREASQERRAERHPSWKGGRRVINGYTAIYLPDDHPFASMRMKSGRYVTRHRLAVAEHLGMPLTSKEIVHHKDGDIHNNAIENLELTSLGAHAKDHGRGYRDGYSKGYAEGLARATEKDRA